MEENKTKPKYNMWQNSAFMVRLAWREQKSVLVLCLLLALVTAAKSIAELLIAPTVLAQLESASSLGVLLGTIAVFAGALIVLSGLREYVSENTLCGRISVRTRIVEQLNAKRAETSYPNLMDTRFLAACKKADQATGSNRAATEAVWRTWTDILANAICFAVYLALLSDLAWWVIVLVCVTAAASYLIGNRINEWGYRHREEANAFHKKLAYLYNTGCNRTYGKDIRIFGLKPWLDEVWNKTMEATRAFLTKQEGIYLWANVADVLFTLLRNGVAYAYLLHLAIRGGLSASEFLLYFSAVSGFAQWVTGLLDQFSTLHKQSLDLSIVREVLEWPEPFRFAGGKPLVREDKPYELRLENVSYRYPGAQKDTLSHIDLTVHPGEKLAIVGLNGAGKTTMVKLLCGFLDPTEGRVLLDGQDIREFNRQEYYRLFTAVFQDFSVLEASVAVNVAQTLTDYDEARVWACLEQAGLTEKVKSLPQGVNTPIGRQVFIDEGVELSGGQTQRLMLARALYKNAPILLLDEPTAALDPIAEDDIYRKYNAMTAGRTSIFISHRLASTRFCDRILFLAGGAIAEEGTHEALLAANGGYAELFHVQSRYYREGGDAHEEE